MSCWRSSIFTRSLLTQSVVVRDWLWRPAVDRGSWENWSTSAGRCRLRTWRCDRVASSDGTDCWRRTALRQPTSGRRSLRPLPVISDSSNCTTLHANTPQIHHRPNGLALKSSVKNDFSFTDLRCRPFNNLAYSRVYKADGCIRLQKNKKA